MQPQSSVHGQVTEPGMCESARHSFVTTNYSINTRGVKSVINTPLTRKGASNPLFFQQLESAFNHAKSQGVQNPIAIGAIPFDSDEPCSLVIPNDYTRTDGLRNASTTDNDAYILPQVNSCESVPNREKFQQGVKQAVANFKLSDIEKTVLSRTLNVALSDTLDSNAVFERIAKQNPGAYKFHIPVADGAVLMGASPELLLRKQGKKIYSNPLAGSAKRLHNAALDQQICTELLASNKDKVEHRYVIDDMRKQLTPLCQTLDVPDQPSLLSTETMWHLSTEIDGELIAKGENALKLASVLHPTPALCGYPRVQAKKLINLIEPFERKFFGGIVGWCDAEGNGEWVVTIRCGMFKGNTIELFAGAGIIEDSCPISEWNETQAKLKTMLNAIGLPASLVEQESVPNYVSQTNPEQASRRADESTGEPVA